MSLLWSAVAVVGTSLSIYVCAQSPQKWVPADEMVQVMVWLVGGASDEGVAHIAGHRNSRVDVSASRVCWAVELSVHYERAGSEEGGEADMLHAGQDRKSVV